MVDPHARTNFRPQAHDRGVVTPAEPHPTGLDVSRLRDADRTAIRGQLIGFVFQSFHLLSYRSVWTTWRCRRCIVIDAVASVKQPRSRRWPVWGSSTACGQHRPRCRVVSVNGWRSPGRS